MTCRADAAQKLKRLLKGLPADDALGIIEEGCTHEVDATVCESLGARGLAGVILCVDREPSDYIDLLKKRRIPIANIRFVDATGSGQRGPNIVAVDNLNDLNTLRLALLEQVERVRKKGRCFVLFDALASMELYNEPEVFARFLHANSMRFRALKVCQIYLVEPESRLVRVMKRLCDRIIELEGAPEDEYARALGADV